VKRRRKKQRASIMKRIIATIKIERKQEIQEGT